MDLSNFKLLKEDDDSYEIGHPSGKKLKVSKKGLSSKAHDTIKKYAEGGTVEPAAPAVDPYEARQAAFKDAIGKVGEALTPAPETNQNAANFYAQQREQGKSSPAMPEGTTMVASNGPGLPQGALSPGGEPMGGNPLADAKVIQQGTAVQNQQEMDPLLQQKMSTAKLLDTQEKQITDYTQATEKLNNATASFYKDYNKQMDQMESPQEIVQSYKAKDDALMKAYTDNKIDPNRFYKNQSTGSRVASAIGLILSGAGAGVTGGPNLAMQQLNRAVDADIDAQKNEQSKNLSLFQMNRQALGDDLKAQAATQNQLWTGVQAKVAMATAMAQNPAVKLKGQQMINEIEQQKFQNRLQLGLIRGDGSTVQQPGGPKLSSADPAVLVPMFIKDPGQQKQAYDEVQKAQDASRSYKEMLEAFDEAAKKNTVVRTVGGIRTPTSMTRLDNLALPLIRDQVGRVSEFEHDAFKDLKPQIGDADSKIEEKRQAMIDFWRAKMSAPNVKGASGGAIDLSKFSSTALPAPAETQTMGGQQYVKVKGGWQKVSTR